MPPNPWNQDKDWSLTIKIMEPTAMEIVKTGNAKSNLRSKLKFKKNQEDKGSYMMINVLVSLSCFSIDSYLP